MGGKGEGRASTGTKIMLNRVHMKDVEKLVESLYGVRKRSATTSCW